MAKERSHNFNFLRLIFWAFLRRRISSFALVILPEAATGSSRQFFLGLVSGARKFSNFAASKNASRDLVEVGRLSGGAFSGVFCSLLCLAFSLGLSDVPFIRFSEGNVEI